MPKKKKNIETEATSPLSVNVVIERPIFLAGRNNLFNFSLPIWTFRAAFPYIRGESASQKKNVSSAQPGRHVGTGRCKQDFTFAFMCLSSTFEAASNQAPLPQFLQEVKTNDGDAISTASENLLIALKALIGHSSALFSSLIKSG